VADHPKAVVSVIDVWPALNNCLCSVLGLVKFSSIDQGDHGVGRVVDLGVAVLTEVGVMLRQMIWRLSGRHCRPALLSRSPFGDFVLSKATLLVLLATPTGAAIIPSDFGHFPQLDGKDGHRCTKPCWPMPGFTNCC
jgi:hypothetical protein